MPGVPESDTREVDRLVVSRRRCSVERLVIRRKVSLMLPLSCHLSRRQLRNPNAAVRFPLRPCLGTGRLISLQQKRVGCHFKISAEKQRSLGF